MPFFIVLTMTLTSCVSRRIAEKDILYPVKIANLSDKLTLEDVTVVTDDSIHLDSWFVKNPNATGTILYCGGNGFSLHHRLTFDIINVLTGSRKNLLMFDYRGYGRSEGVTTLKGIQKDGEAALRYLCSRPDVNSRRIVLYGHSLGTFVALRLGISAPVSAVILQSPMTNAPEMKDALVRANVPWYARWLVRGDLDPNVLKLDNLEFISQSTVPLLILTGENDILTPVEMGRKLYEAGTSKQKRFEVVPRADHDDLFFTNDQRKQYYVKTVTEFLDSVLR